MKDKSMNIYKINHAKKLKTSIILNNKHIWLSPSGVVSNARKKDIDMIKCIMEEKEGLTND